MQLGKKVNILLIYHLVDIGWLTSEICDFIYKCTLMNIRCQ